MKATTLVTGAGRKKPINSQRRQTMAALALTALLLAACGSAPRHGTTNRSEGQAMLPSTTYLHLLKDTPFFAALTRPQLLWVIDHSKEWEAPAGTVVASRTVGEPASEEIWVLLDGGWRVEAGGKQYPAGHADPGKWFSAADIAQECRLIVTEKSYVMKIERAEMGTMLAQSFAFGPHLEAGKAYYRTLFN